MWFGEKYIVKMFQPNNGIGGSYWVINANNRTNGVASEDELTTK
jgi:hypothetical protein